MKNLLFTLAGIATFAFAGCDNDDDDVANTMEPTATRTEMIASSDWMVTSAVRMEEGQAVDMFATLPATAKDDVFKFEETGEIVRAEGETKDIGASDIVDTGEWSFMNEEKDLKVDLQSMQINDEIVELSRNRLVIRNFDGQSETITTFQAE